MIDKSLFFRTCTLALAILSVCGCSLVKARPAELSGFLPKGELLAEDRKRAPFNGYWVFHDKQYYELRRAYRRVYVAPVDTTFVEKIYRAASGSEKTKTRRIQEAKELASYFEAKLKLIIEDSRDLPFQLVDQPGEGVMTLRLALTQIVPTNPGINLAGTAAGFFVPGGGLIKILGEGSIAMEGYVEERGPKEPYEQYKDREGQKISAFSFKDYQRYAHIREAIDDWSMQVVELLATPPDHTVADSLAVTLNPI